ncbi:hypothetical protein MML48_7g00007002 [Holotrichia oblita]|uniref:Uncharacterized protein n=1 Tax=Holotrichia oblita TaxID=644536 RepID=A0ACB9SRF7_HOLOL|nr:hypothetical protein MML48_7g00007002 [Holotrichia oblita]
MRDEPNIRSGSEQIANETQEDRLVIQGHPTIRNIPTVLFAVGHRPRELQESELQRRESARLDDATPTSGPKLFNLRFHRDVHGRIVGRSVHGTDTDELAACLPGFHHAEALLRSVPFPSEHAVFARPLVSSTDSFR